MHAATFFILASLLGEPRHGYAIIAAARELSGGTVDLKAGTLYGALDRLAEQGQVAVDREEVVRGRVRRYYCLTADGRAAVLAEAERMQAAAAAVQRLARPLPEPSP
jgi:DNA-binding PadR family transcriptional regulator